jgi:hypothetical protein
VEERRRYQRSATDDGSAKTLLVDCGVAQEAARVINYSSGGLSLLTGKALPTNKDLIISFDQPEQKNLKLTGKVVWVRPKDEFWCSGLNLNTI